MTVVPMIAVWKSQAVVMLRNDKTVADLQRALADAVEQVDNERRAEVARRAQTLREQP